jgi:Uncharacterised protein family (UPF0104).
MSVRKKIEKGLTIVFYILIAAFIVYNIMNLDFATIKDVNVNWFLLIASTLVRTGSLLLLPLSWKILLGKYVKKSINMGKLYEIYAKSWLGRYIPGKVAWVGGKIYFAVQEKIDSNVAIITSFLDSVIQIFSCMLIGVAFFAFTDTAQINQNTVILIYVLTVVMVICLIPRIFNWLTSIIYRILKRTKLEEKYYMNGKTLISGISVVVISKIISGIGTSFIILAVYPNLTFQEFIFSLGVFSVSTAIGMAALFAPAGIGVKEGMQLVLLVLIIPREFGVITVALVSVQSIIIDLMFYAISKGIFKFESPLKKKLK